MGASLEQAPSSSAADRARLREADATSWSWGGLYGGLVLAAVITDHAVFHGDHPIGMPDQARIVLTHSSGGAMRTCVAMQDVDHALTVLGVQRAGGFVGEDQRRRLGERAGDSDALFLATGQLRRAHVAAVAEPTSSSAMRASGSLSRLRMPR